MHVPIQNRNKIVGNPCFLGESPCNDIIISEKRHVLAPKSLKTRCARDFMPGMVQSTRRCHLEKLNMWLTLKFQMLFVTKWLEDLT